LLQLEDAIRLALDTPAPSDGDATTARGWSLGPLTPREVEVAALVNRGLDNRQIAEELLIARGTSERHMANST
jgi:DNA-binding NarL/FixJ family response regulator